MENDDSTNSVSALALRTSYGLDNSETNASADHKNWTWPDQLLEELDDADTFAKNGFHIIETFIENMLKKQTMSGISSGRIYMQSFMIFSAFLSELL